MQKYLILSLIFFISCETHRREINDELINSTYIKTDIFEVWYNEDYEQPIRLTYESTNRENNYSRDKMSFYTNDSIKTSDHLDYYNNIYDRGHIAPAASFADSLKNLHLTFSYLNVMLQHQNLNRGHWRILENLERRWDDTQDLKITVDLLFNENHEILSTGAHVPTDIIKHIYFTNDNKWRCFEYKNTNTSGDILNYERLHFH